MGSEPAAEFAPDPDEAPRHRLSCAAFAIGRTPVTNGQYRAFVAAIAYPMPSHWAGGSIPTGRDHHPVTYVSHADAAAFCRWAGGRLPTEAEWERAARGDDGRTWPWGEESPGPELATFAATETSPVGLHPRGAGPFGALDLAGNAWEWTSSAALPYPYDPADGREEARRLAEGRPRRRVHPRAGRDSLLLPPRHARRRGRPLRRLPARLRPRRPPPPRARRRGCARRCRPARQ